MHPSSLKLSPSPSPSPSPLLITTAINFHHPTNIVIESGKGYPKRPFVFKSVKCMQSPDKLISRNSKGNSSPVSFLAKTEVPVQSLNVAEKVHSLATEFKSLSEPIERVKRLLHYAALLPPFDESARVQENRVMGCTTMVWLEVGMDNRRLMRFRVDSDSEITKGFCYCLIWLFDGAAAEEVLSIEIDDLVEMNVGMPSRGQSRVNTWHNILISMRKKTQNLVEERDKEPSLKDFAPLVVSPDSITINGSH